MAASALQPQTQNNQVCQHLTGTQAQGSEMKGPPKLHRHTVPGAALGKSNGLLHSKALCQVCT